jgi:hypothetical protein
MSNYIKPTKTKRASYVYIGDEDELEDIDKVIELKNLGNKNLSKLNKIVSCIQGIGCEINECYGLDYEEILSLLEEFYDYKIINKEEMIEPYNYTVIDINYNWEMYAQIDDYSEECDKLAVEGLKEKLKEIMNFK